MKKIKWRDYLPFRWCAMDTDKIMDMPERWWFVQFSYLFILLTVTVFLIAMGITLAMTHAR